MSFLARRGSPAISTLRPQFFEPFNEFFNDFVEDFFSDKDVIGKIKAKGGYPKLDISDEGEQWIIRAAIPGIKLDEMKVEVLDGVLRLSGKMAQEYESKTQNYHVK